MVIRKLDNEGRTKVVREGQQFHHHRSDQFYTPFFDLSWEGLFIVLVAFGVGLFFCDGAVIALGIIVLVLSTFGNYGSYYSNTFYYHAGGIVLLLRSRFFLPERTGYYFTPDEINLFYIRPSKFGEDVSFWFPNKNDRIFLRSRVGVFCTFSNTNGWEKNIGKARKLFQEKFDRFDEPIPELTADEYDKLTELPTSITLPEEVELDQFKPGTLCLDLKMETRYYTELVVKGQTKDGEVRIIDHSESRFWLISKLKQKASSWKELYRPGRFIEELTDEEWEELVKKAGFVPLRRSIGPPVLLGATGVLMLLVAWRFSVWQDDGSFELDFWTLLLGGGLLVIFLLSLFVIEPLGTSKERRWLVIAGLLELFGLEGLVPERFRSEVVRLTEERFFEDIEMFWLDVIVDKELFDTETREGVFQGGDKAAKDQWLKKVLRPALEDVETKDELTENMKARLLASCFLEDYFEEEEETEADPDDVSV